MEDSKVDRAERSYCIKIKAILTLLKGIVIRCMLVLLYI